MTGYDRSNRQVAGCLAVFLLIAGVAAGACAEEPTRYDVLYADSLEPVELEAKILEINLHERYIIIAEQMVWLVTAEEALPPVTRTKLFDLAGRAVAWNALKVRQRVSVRGLMHPSGHIVANEIAIVNKAIRSGRYKNKGNNQGGG